MIQVGKMKTTKARRISRAEKTISILVLLFFIAGCAEKTERLFAEQPEEGAEEKGMFGQEKSYEVPREEMPPEGIACSIKPGEWHPGQGECPGTTTESKTRCDEFCTKHPDCCLQRAGGRGGFGEQNLVELPSEEEISKLARNYPSIIKAINEGPTIYKQGTAEVISDETLDRMKETGFNTIQVLIIDDCSGEKCIIEEYSKNVLLNDIVKAKQKGLAVWVALEFINAPPGSEKKLPEYETFKPAYLDLCRETGELLENYKVEYFTVNNEPDLFLQEQTHWGSEAEIDKKVAEIFVLSNSAAKEKFSGKMINKITQVKKRPKETIDASFKNVDIASIDVGPPANAQMGIEGYKSDFEDYQYYASLAEKAGVPWMVGEYWTYNFFETPNDYVKANQKTLARISFDAYLSVSPKGVGYSWNDFSAFNVQPDGEETRLAVKDFLRKI